MSILLPVLLLKMYTYIFVCVLVYIVDKVYTHGILYFSSV